MKKRTLLVAGAAVLMVGYLLIRTSDSPRSNAAKSEDTKAELNRLKNDIRLMKNRLGYVNTVQRSHGRDISTLSTADDRTVPTDSDSASALHPRETARPGKEVLAEQRELLETTMKADDDPTWTVWAENKLGDIITAKSISGSRGIEIQCASSICRVTMQFDNSDDSQSAMRLLPTLVPWDAQGFFLTDPGTHATTVYVARDGEELPRADQSS